MLIWAISLISIHPATTVDTQSTAGVEPKLAAHALAYELESPVSLEPSAPLSIDQIIALRFTQALAADPDRPATDASSPVPLPTKPPVPQTSDTDALPENDGITETEFPNTELVGGNAVAIVPLDIPLDVNVQHRIFEEVCDNDDFETQVKTFIMLMAVASFETGQTFRTNLISSADAYGLFQIRAECHYDRMARYGIETAEGLFDPVQSAYVALDYLNWIKKDLGVSEFTSAVYVVYNAGHYTEWESVQRSGHIVMSYYDAFMAEFITNNPSLTIFA